ncbi:glycogen debranching protein GlgX [Caldimonas tepidiphila]|uniref:glycogen debranching protein GlgX n=1 Tax=Caldimonas tepidiphila TaxID=2315841 RepID=UPI000E5AC479|nr:glycogen debranching protein GlgX [Caldimonas tepidiphila]
MDAFPPLQPGRAHPLGATPEPGGINFALWAPEATAVELCLFDDAGREERARLPLPGCSEGVWHGRLDGGAPGLVYGYRVHGPWAPQRGLRFNPAKVLLDPYAREVVGRYGGDLSLYLGHDPQDRRRPDARDNAAVALKARVVDEPFDWGGDRAPGVPRERMVIYELHVKGASALHPGVPEALRGTYAGLAHPALLDHLQGLGVTTLSLLPVHHRADEARLQQLGLSNYWGYSSIAFFAPETRYWSGRPGTTPRSEFREMVRALHARGLEVVLDVVYNHTAETDELGPTLSFRGIGNAQYYRLDPADPALYVNWSGCGNVLNLGEPRVVQLVIDSLRHWVEEMHVDGFRFDLAPILGRGEDGHFSRAAGFFAALQSDPVLARVKWIAEPWDCGPGGYQLGSFPAGWLEWNDRYRDTMRSQWLHHGIDRDATRGAFAQRFAGSSASFHRRARAPGASVNFVTAHDGFTLRDLVSYERRHNEPNGEHNRDGHAHNHSWNCGVEGPSDDPAVLALRARLQRALLATLLLSQGTPMLLAGDEIGHSQRGNNNAYCQDNETTWLDWARADADLCACVARLIALRRDHAALRPARWLAGTPEPGGVADVEWLSPRGEPLRDGDWERHDEGALMIRLAPQAPANGALALLLVNPSAHEVRLRPPAPPSGAAWQPAFDSGDARGEPAPGAWRGGELLLPPHTLLLALSQPPGAPGSGPAGRP